MLLEEAGIDHNPAGWPRPCWNRIPIPWVVTVTEHGSHFRSVDDRRLAACQLDLLCQVCGIPAHSPVAVVIVDRDGCCLTPAPIHRRDCAALARTRCRAAAAGIMIDFDPERLHCVADSHLTLQAGFAEQWYFSAPFGGSAL